MHGQTIDARISRWLAVLLVAIGCGRAEPRDEPPNAPASRGKQSLSKAEPPSKSSPPAWATSPAVLPPRDEFPSHNNAPAPLMAPFNADEARAAQTAWAHWLGDDSHEVTDAVGIELVLIPPGEFSMGTAEGEPGRRWTEEQHEVRIAKPFYMGKCEVTQEQFERVMKFNPSYFSSTGEYADRVAGLDTSRFPVETVKWAEAEAFCHRMTAREGRTYRLPTEAEWEYACRAGTTTAYHFGEALNGQEANVDGESPFGTEIAGPDLGRPAVVGSYSPNPFGLYDMHGNVWEWCDFDGESFHVRGAGYRSIAEQARSAWRLGGISDYAIFDRGFRVVVEPELRW